MKRLETEDKKDVEGKKGIGRAFDGVRTMLIRLVSREGFVGVWVGGDSPWHRWRMDARDGWLLDGGVPIDKLLKVRK